MHACMYVYVCMYFYVCMQVGCFLCWWNNYLLSSVGLGHDIGPHRLQHGERGGGCDQGRGGAAQGRGEPEERHVHTVYHPTRDAHHHHARGAHLEALSIIEVKSPKPKSQYPQKGEGKKHIIMYVYIFVL